MIIDKNICQKHIKSIKFTHDDSDYNESDEVRMVCVDFKNGDTYYITCTNNSSWDVYTITNDGIYCLFITYIGGYETCDSCQKFLNKLTSQIGDEPRDTFSEAVIKINERLERIEDMIRYLPDVGQGFKDARSDFTVKQMEQVGQKEQEAVKN